MDYRRDIHTNAKKGDISLAVEALKQALDIDPEDVTSAVNLARLLEKSGQIDHAFEAYQRVVSLSPTAKNYEYLILFCQKISLKVFKNSA